MPIDGRQAALLLTNQAINRPWPKVHAVTAALCGIALSTALPVAVRAQPVAAQQAPAAEQVHRIPAGPLAPALRAFASSANLLLTFTAEQTDGKTTGGIDGRYTPQAALVGLLAGTGLQAVQLSNGGYVLRAGAAPSPAPTGGEAMLPAVRVVAASGSGAGRLPAPYAGGQVASGARLGMLGNVDIMDTPFNVTAYTAELIENQQARNLVDVLDNDPSAHAAGPWHFDNFYIRGFRVLRDEIGFDGLYGIASSEGILLEGLERVEVLKGPSTLLNGSSPEGSPGGAINLVPKRATDEPLTRFTGSYMNNNLFGAHADVGRRFGPDNAFGVRVNAAYRNGDTPVERESERAGVVTAGLDYRGKSFRVSLDGGGSNDRIDGARGNFLLSPGVALPSPLAGDKSVWQRWEYQNKNYQFGMARGEWDITDNTSVGFAYGASRSARDQISSFQTITGANGATSASTSGTSSVSDAQSGELNFGTGFATGAVEHRLTAVGTIVATNFSQERLNNLGNYTSNLFDPTIVGAPANMQFTGSRPKVSASRQRSVAITDTMKAFDDKLALTVGVRRQQIEVDGFDTATGAQTAHYNESKTTPAVALVYKPFNSLSLYGNYVEGLSAGASAPTSAVNAGQIFAPFVSKQGEIGTKYDFGTFATTLSLFQITQPSGIINSSNVFSVDGQQRNRGVELNTFGELTHGVRVLGGIAWMRGTLTHTDRGLNDGARAAGTPAVQIKLGGEWDIGALPGLTASTRVVYTSSQTLSQDDSVRMPSWARWDLGARYATRIAGKKTVFRASVENVTNAKYWDSVIAYNVMTYGTPRTFLLSASVDF
ncbi:MULTISPECIES: TonB-dependent siderophore receptor [Cupriavidus]